MKIEKSLAGLNNNQQSRIAEALKTVQNTYNEIGNREKINTLGGGRGGGTSQAKRGLFLGRLSMFLRGNSIILCVSLFLSLFFSNFPLRKRDDTMNLQDPELSRSHRSDSN